MKDQDSKELKKQIGERFAMLRNDLKLTQQELADKLGTSQNLVYRLENNLSCSMDSILVAYIFFVRNYKVNPEWLFAIDTDGIARYNLDARNQKRKKDAEHQRRNEIFEDMLTELRKNKLI
ncbi:helix-turn-helix protein [Spirosoma oryzae]|uniref:Helix-turn-helix protein n=1 Tax=Spirosoma oryzae TaxID=1469603 RepID=A0A2T0S2Z4_9BACT|nr:helix-turn-helix transcriptional regulator [Spirosoma oryzae]PRY27806.1 helix-turn-helix protein [Spirosoma oryzae]